MSADSGRLKRGNSVYHNGEKKIVKNWHFVSDSGMHNSDLIVIEFKDGTTTKDEGFTNVEYHKPNKKAMKRVPITHSDVIRMSFEEKLKRTDFFVEATSFEQHAIWKKYTKESRDPFDGRDINGVIWFHDSSGFGKTLGYIGVGKKRPVVVSFSWYAIGDKYVCFYHPTSRFVDWTMIEKWIEKNFPVKYDNGTRRAMTDADNFHNCYHFCKDE